MHRFDCEPMLQRPDAQGLLVPLEIGSIAISLMKTSIIFLSLVAMLGCSKQQSSDNPKSDKPKSTAASSPTTASAADTAAPRITFVKSEEAADREKIGTQALTSLTNKDYSGIEALAAKYRASKEQYANGGWKLAEVYNGLAPSDEATDAAWEARIKQVQDWA